MDKYSCDIVVVGGGVIGCSAAYYLSKKYRVILVEKEYPGAGASGACSGGLNYFGKKGKILEQAVESLYIYKDLEKKLQIDLEKDQNRKILLIANEENQLELINKLVEECVIKGLNAKFINCRTIKKMLPVIPGNLVGGAIAGGGLQGVVNPFNLILGFLQKFRDNKGIILKKQKVEELLVKNKKIEGVRTTSFKIKSFAVLITAGYDSIELLNPFSFNTHLIPCKGTVLITEKNPNWLKINLLSAGFLKESNRKNKVNLTIEQTFSGNILIGSSSEFYKNDKLVNNDIVMEIAQKAIKLLPILRKEKIIRIFTGVRPFRQKGPFIGKIPKIEGLFAAFGHSGMGITLAPYVGKKISTLM